MMKQNNMRTYTVRNIGAAGLGMAFVGLVFVGALYVSGQTPAEQREFPGPGGPGWGRVRVGLEE